MGEPGDLPATELLNLRVKGLQTEHMGMVVTPRLALFALLLSFFLTGFLQLPAVVAADRDGYAAAGDGYTAGWDNSVAVDQIIPETADGRVSKEGNGATDTETRQSAPSDSVRMDAIHVRSTRISEPLRHQPVDVQRIDSTRMDLYRSGSVSEVLSRYSGINIRDNGPGGLATISQRGLSPSQTQVLWEGFPINTPSLGLSDLSVIPAGLFESVEVSPGTPSSAFGGGSLGGTVYLGSGPDRRQTFAEAEQSVGSFGTTNSRIGGAWSGDRLSVSLQGIYRQAENDFDYYNRATGMTEQRRHNAGRSGHFSGLVSYRQERTRIYSRFWIHDTFDEIPGTILAGNPQAEQTLRGVRWTAGVETRRAGWRIDSRIFVDEDRFTYDDPPTNIASRFRRGRGVMSVDLKRPSAGWIRWKGSVSAGREYVRTDNYLDRKERILFDGRVAPDIRLYDDRLRVTPTLRFDSYSDFGQVISPSIGANWALYPQRFYLRGMVSRDFNPPSFNDLYWVPGGNPDLNPERSWKAEAGAVYEPGLELVESLRITAYRIWLNEGIYWFPSGGGDWVPDNVQKVDAYGLEAGLDTGWQIGRAEVRWSALGEWQRSLIASARFSGDQGVGRQMRYVPEWSARSGLGFHLDPLSMNLDYRWTGRRYLTQDHSSSLDPFQVTDLSAAVRHRWLQADWTIRVSVRNLLDEEYEIVRWYPMPKRHLEVSLGLRIH